MILDMIQGCRYLRRSTDRWLLSKNLTTRLKDSMFGTGPVLLWRCSIPITDIKGLYLYLCPNMTPGRLRVEHLISKLMLRHQCPSCTCHQFIPSLYWATSSRILENFLLKVQTVLLPNDGGLPTASILAESSREIFFCQMAFCYQTRPTSQFFSFTNFRW
jgi:hypothetical protein